MNNFFAEMSDKYVDKFWPGMCEPVPEDRQDDLAAEVHITEEDCFGFFAEDIGRPFTLDSPHYGYGSKKWFIVALNEMLARKIRREKESRE